MTAGPQYVKAAGTSTIGQFVVPNTSTAGYTQSVTLTGTAANPGLVAGSATRTIDTACNATTNCQYSQFLNGLNIR